MISHKDSASYLFPSLILYFRLLLCKIKWSKLLYAGEMAHIPHSSIWGKSMLQSNIDASTFPKQWIIQVANKMWQLLFIIVPKRQSAVPISLRVTIFPVTYWTAGYVLIICFILSNFKFSIFHRIQLFVTINIGRLRLWRFIWRTNNSFGTGVQKGLYKGSSRSMCPCAYYDPVPPSSNLGNSRYQ